MKIFSILILILVVLLASCSRDPCQHVVLFEEAQSNQDMFQSEYFTLLTGEFPQHAEALQTNYALQKVYSDLHLIEFRYIHENHPEQIDLLKGFNGLMNFSQSDSLEKTLTQNNTAYAKLMKKKAEIEKQSRNSHEQRENLKLDIQNSPVSAQVTGLSKELMLKSNDLEQKIIACGEEGS